MTRQPSRGAVARRDALEQLRRYMPPGTTVYTALKGDPSRSGMSRTIALYVIEDGEPHWLSWWAATALGERWDDRREGLRVSGAGMDMGLHVVMSLSYALHPDGFDCTGETCPSNDHSNGDRDHTPHHHGSGYSLRQRWL